MQSQPRGVVVICEVVGRHTACPVRTWHLWQPAPTWPEKGPQELVDLAVLLLGAPGAQSHLPWGHRQDFCIGLWVVKAVRWEYVEKGAARWRRIRRPTGYS